ncbi:MAG: hypothetical protein A3H71_01890 [Candidatus Sungbacteria bacterium RIFCSPLOWO2_02_FULL_48_13b]|uniref:EamA domain-containing protein n=2 Tax=Candidatus Sungiibacteriota TaxID=1817917 RepID=A0A1G2LFA1_9BACT|nr:MAG: hypothetical protein A3C12_01355 [Candidatus Sungbacteria bacterium RIFCSPHIGHO2_02_FULL_49_20]OHA10318.1 MAG: hypothetical protein A3H71_01890 [Candidatus Sungbacteria bacterium RIFCSPLOWO2_02_FULL_48_13b]
MSLTSISLLLFAVASAVSTQLIFKYWVLDMGAFSISFAGVFAMIWKILQNPLMLAALFLYGLGFLSWVYLLSRNSLSLVYPVVLSLNIILIFMFSRLLFHETVSMLQMAGIAVIIAGIYIVFTA